MRLHRFFGPFVFHQKTGVIQDPTLLHQLRAVLRCRSGEEAIFINDAGQEARVRLLLNGPKEIEFQVLERLASEREPAINVTLCCAVLKRENFEWVVQKATEVGVRRIVPFLSQHTVKSQVKLDRLGKIIKEAAEQSGRTVLPELATVMSFSEAAENVSGLSVFFDLGGKSLQTCPAWQKAKERTLWIGPEGGWIQQERELAEEKGWEIASLGVLTLRAETAAAIAGYLGCQS